MASRNPDHNLLVTPSLDPSSRVVVTASSSPPASATAYGILVARNGTVPDELGIGRDRLEAAGSMQK